MEQLEERALLSGKGVAFFVNGYTGHNIPEDVFSHLETIAAQTGGLDWDLHNDGELDIYETNWNSPDPRLESGYPGDIFDVTFHTLDLFGYEIPYGVEFVDVVTVPDPVGPGEFVTALANVLDTEYDDDDFVMLVGHSLGGNSVLEVANATSVEIDLLAALDPVGWTHSREDLGSFTVSITPEVSFAGQVVVPAIEVPVPMDELADFFAGDFEDPERGFPGYRKDLPPGVNANVKYFYNRWQQNFPFPLDYVRSGELDASQVQCDVSQFNYNGRPIQEQAASNDFRDENGNPIKRNPDLMDLLFEHSVLTVEVQGIFDVFIGFPKTSVSNHSDLPLDKYIQAELSALVDHLIPQPPDVDAGPDRLAPEGEVQLEGTIADLNPVDTHTIQWQQLSGPVSVSLSGADTLTPTFLVGDNYAEPFEFELSVSDGTFTVKDTVEITVVNAPPQVESIHGPGIWVRGFPAGLSTEFSDAGFLDTHEVSWDFGDGTGLGWRPATGPGYAEAAHRYVSKGTYTFQATVRDDDGGVAPSEGKDIEVRAVALVPNPDNPDVFDLLIGGTTDADVILVRATGNPGEVEVIINGQSEGIFVPTGDIKVAAQSGDDTIIIGAGLERPVVAYGDTDNDTFRVGTAQADGPSAPVHPIGDAGNVALTIRSTTPTAPVILHGGEDNDRYEFFAGASVGDYTVVELANEGDDLVDFTPLGRHSPAQTIDWLNPGGAATAESLAAHPGVGNVSVGAEGQQLNIEYGLNVRPHLDPIQGDKRGVRCEPIPYDVRFVDVGTKMTHTAVIDWGDGKSESGNVHEDPTTVEGSVGGTHAYTKLGEHEVHLTVTDNSPYSLWPLGADYWTSSANASARVEILPAVIKDDPQRPGEQALFVGGSLAPDEIYVYECRNGDLRVSMNRPRRHEVFRHGVDGPTDDGHIYIFTCRGNDRVRLFSNVHHDAVIYSGPGKDLLIGGRGNDLLDGGAGNDRLCGQSGSDILVGAGGQDRLYGRGGRDLLIGGQGEDWLFGGSKDDILIGGITDYDTDLRALLAVMSEWNRPLPIDTRITHLKQGTGVNGSVLLTPGGTVNDDARASDRLFGGRGADWYLWFDLDSLHVETQEDRAN